MAAAGATRLARAADATRAATARTGRVCAMKGIRRMLRVRSVERDVDEEIALYFEETLRELEARGMTPGAARAEAARRFGDTHHYRSELMRVDRQAARRGRWSSRLDAVRDTAAHAVRGAVRSRALSAGIVLAFALGIGANATMYETVERMLLRAPPHIVEPDDVRRLLVRRLIVDEIGHVESISFPEYRDLARTTDFAGAAAHSGQPVTLGHGVAAQEARAVWVTASYWPLIGVQPALGRFFTEGEDAVGAPGTAVLSWARWQSEYGGAADVIGRTLDFGYGPYTIIGVTPKGFTGVDLGAVDFFAPLMVAGGHVWGGSEWVDSRGWSWLQALARRAPGTALAAAEAEATAVWHAGHADAAAGGARRSRGFDENARIVAAPVLVAQGPDAPTEVAVARWLLGVAAVVLLIACLNVANLLLARMLQQGRELSIRLALGISRRRLVAQIVAEGLVLGVAGGAAALLIAFWGGSFVQNALLPGVDWSGGPSPTVLLLVLGLALLAGVLSAVVPAVQASRGVVSAGLRTASGGISRSTARVRSSLSILQAALSMLLLIGAGLFVRSLNSIHARDFGLDLWQVAQLAPEFTAGSITPEEQWAPYEAAVARVRRVPGVAGASLASGIPFRSSYANTLRAEGVDSLPRSSAGNATSNVVDAEYFRALGIALVQGRHFDARDTRSASRVAIINEPFARALWPGESPLGKCLFIGPDDPPCSEIVGVVASAARSRLVGQDDAFQYYTPLEQRQLEARLPEAILLRVDRDRDMATVLAAAQREVLSVDDRIRWVRAEPMADMVAGQLRQWRLGATMFTVFGVLALVVAAIGLYSVLAFDVAQRVREIGLRTALGATSRAIVALVLARAVRITAAGTTAGALLALLLAPRLHGMLHDTDPRDPLTFAVVTGVLAVVAMIAAGLPAWRASKVDPNVALRSD